MEQKKQTASPPTLPINKPLYHHTSYQEIDQWIAYKYATYHDQQYQDKQTERSQETTTDTNNTKTEKI